MDFIVSLSYMIAGKTPVVEVLPILVSKVTACLLISAFASLVCVPVGITSFAAEMKICAFTAEIKKYKSIMKTKKKKHDKKCCYQKITHFSHGVFINGIT